MPGPSLHANGAHVVIAHADDPSLTDEFVALLRQADPSTPAKVVDTNSADEVTEAARRAASSGARSVTAIGGDGTVNLVAPGVVGSPTTLAVAPAGTVNLLGKLVGITSFTDTVDAMAADRRDQFDIGEVSAGSDSTGSAESSAATSAATGMFVINASSGFDATVIDDAADHSDARFGRLRFFVAGVKRLRRYRPRSVAVEVDGERWFDGRAMSVVVMNVGQRASADFDVAPDARPDDGRLDVAVVRCSSIVRTAVVALRLVTGRPVPPDDVVYGQGERIVVTWEQEVTTQRDGDARSAASRLEYSVRPRAMAVYVGADPKIGETDATPSR